MNVSYWLGENGGVANNSPPLIGPGLVGSAQEGGHWLQSLETAFAVRSGAGGRGSLGRHPVSSHLNPKGL